MASSKSTIKVVDKTQLYFNKYSYKATITTPGVYWIRMSNDINDFTSFVLDRYDEWEQQKARYPRGWYREPLPLSGHDLDLIEDIINIKKGLQDTDTRFRHEYETFSLYTNDEALIKSLIKKGKWRIEKAETSPTGIKYFKKDPPAKFRAYLTNNKVNAEFREEMIDYLNRTPDITPSNAFYEWLHRHNKYAHAHIWLWCNYFVDYDDERNLMMLRLLFPEAIGKTYKLEKKP